MKTIADFLFVFIFLFVLSAQQVIAQEKTETERQNKPEVKIKVNKELDNNGNIIRYDSTYSWSWSSEGYTQKYQGNFNDSLETDFFRPFEKKFFSGDNNFDRLGFFSDSLFMKHLNGFEFDFIQKHMQEMMMQQHKMMEEIFGEPPVIPSLPENKNNEQNQTPVTKTEGSVDI